MKKVSAFFALLFFTFLTFAQNISMESICAELSKNKITKGNFIQEKTITKTGKVLKSSGNFIFSESGILWATEKPFPSTMILGKDFMIQVSADGTKKIMNAGGNEVFKNISSTLLAVFSNNVPALNDKFNIEFNTQKENWTVILKPKDSTVAAFMNSIVLNGNSSSAKTEIISVELTEAKGNKVLYKFINQTHPEELTEDEKTFFDVK
ncbi:MAG: outer membrane lipoprotein carrier protein LolA [Treponema sp.]|nr:outer membrane lipoprotein carrier protein LolA [Spirochaetia bacterium]MDD7460484.1 outer membrane lipoprotein carrier protein LolA [Spirochaetales bacterium]MDY5812030.1 outer membrane lipoprotein carrier protein LolA [Treponema sp.]MEE1181321.1 outer membrane lipoprotein carrier protein LolA [Treponema sp.]